MFYLEQEKAQKAMEAIWIHRSRASDLVGTVINIHNGDWVRRGKNHFHLKRSLKKAIHFYYIFIIPWNIVGWIINSNCYSPQQKWLVVDIYQGVIK